MPFAYGKPVCESQFRVEPEDFQVREQLGFDLSGDGEHLCLCVEKRNQNTRWVARQIAQALTVQEMDIGFCGMKDRRAVTSQWFSVHTANTPKQLSLGDGIEVLALTRHHKKLRRGVHGANDFVIRLRDVVGDRGDIEDRLQKIALQGVPNYFGEQRFGINGGNLIEAEKLLARISQPPGKRRRGRNSQQRGGIYLSAARSYLFNQVLARRVADDTWHTPFTDEGTPEGPLWGRGRSRAGAAVRALEEAVLAGWNDWCHSLEFSGLQQERRVLVLLPEDFRWQWLGNHLELAFSLPSGGYATSVLREVSQLLVS